MLSSDEKIKWIQLTRTVGLGSTALHVLIKVYKTASNILEYMDSIPDEIKLKKIKSIYSKRSAQTELEKTEAFGGKILVYSEPEFSQRLREFHLFPPVITVHGDTSLFTKEIVTMVGSRNASINSKNLSHEFALGLCKQSVVVASGLAKGIDISVNSVILEGFPTIAVLANGIDVTYPTEHTEMQKKIADSGGLIVSEEPFSSKPKPFKFIKRNAIMVALSSGVVIMEASRNSGSINTAMHAIKQQKPLFALPGFAQNQRSSGSNDLLRNGAKFAEFPEDVINEIRKIPKKDKPDLSSDLLFDSQSRCNPFELQKHISPAEKKEMKKEVLNMLDFQPISIDVVIEQSRHSPHLLLSTLVELELADEIIMTDNNEVCLKLKFNSEAPTFEGA